MRVEGWREYARVFGDLDRDLDTPYALRGYFENGGQVAWVIRVAAPNAVASSKTWSATGLAALGDGIFRISAATPGTWSRNARVSLRYRGRTPTGTATVDISTRTTDESEELRSLVATDLVAQVAARSRLIAIEQIGTTGPSTPRGFATDTVVLDQSGFAGAPQFEDYLDAVDQLLDIPEAAIVAFPEIHDLGEAYASRVTRTAAAAFDPLHDRLVLVDLPRDAPRLRWQVDDLLA